MQVIYAKQPFPTEWDFSIFLAGPTPRDSATPSWRPEAIRILEELGYDGVVFNPEVKDGNWGKGPDAYLDQVNWERRGLDCCDEIVFWVPRNMETMPALTTNVEFGRYISSGKVVFGAPPEAKSVKYLEQMNKDDNEGTRHTTLKETLRAALSRISQRLNPLVQAQGYGVAIRKGGETSVPLLVWCLPGFQSWYKSQVKAGNRLDDSKLLWHFRIPKTQIVFSYILWVKVWIAAEERHKVNEFIFTRSDISTVVLYSKPKDHKGSRPLGILGEILDRELILIREFRSPARTFDGCVHELAGGSSFKPGKNPLKTAAEEVKEETGLSIPPENIKVIGSRQLASTLSTHQAHVFVSELSDEDMQKAKTMAAEQEVHGVEEDTERTTLEIVTFRNLLKEDKVDWSTVGMVSQALLLR